MADNKIILWEYQKKRVCEFYGCSDSNGNQYPSCTGMKPERCQLHQIHRLVDKLMEPCEHSLKLNIYEAGEIVGEVCADCGKQFEKEC